MKITAMFPFLDDESKEELVEKLISGEKSTADFSLPSLYPFLRKEHLKKIVEAILEKKIKASLYPILPFLDQETLEKVMEEVQSGKHEHIRSEAILPFMGKDKIRELFKKMMAKESPKEEEPTTEEES